ncbi:MAG: hypothetical protein A2Z14_16125 [Chloroflexi bacterium RBG_16_48_8]|nr:MAG: hypothetical protein A2Z14_16125 [Chloroflexi bacterium RBG_16_48_8]
MQPIEEAPPPLLLVALTHEPVLIIFKPGGLTRSGFTPFDESLYYPLPGIAFDLLELNRSIQFSLTGFSSKDRSILDDWPATMG